MSVILIPLDQFLRLLTHVLFWQNQSPTRKEDFSTTICLLSEFTLSTFAAEAQLHQDHWNAGLKVKTRTQS